MQLLQDVFIVENLQVLAEGKNSDTMKIKGVFGRCNEKNNNGRIYPTSVLEGQLQKVQPLISERRLCGELDHPQNDTVKLSNASHLITKLEMKGNELIGEAEILKTPAGLTAKALVEGGVKIGISSRGMGTLSEDAQGNKVVNEDFRLVTFDLVADPSTRGAFPGLSESTQSQFVREAQSKLEKESNFVTMLQSKLREAYDPWIEEAKKKGKTKKKLDPVDKKEDLVGIDGGIIPQSSVCKGMKAVKEEGSWHQIANAIAEAFADEIDKDKTRTGAADAETRAAKAQIKAQKEKRKTIQKGREARGQGIRGSIKQRIGRRIAQGGEVAQARREGDIGVAKARSAERTGVAHTQAAGAVEREKERERQKTSDAAEGKPVTAGEGIARSAGKKIGGFLAKRKKKKEADQADNSKDSPLENGSTPKPKAKPEAKPKAKPGISDEEKYQRKVLGQADLKKATANVADRAKKEFGAGVGRDDKADRNDKAAMHKAIARRERKTGKKVNLTKQQALDLSHRIYSRMGHSLAEAFGLVEAVAAHQKDRGQSASQEERDRQVKAGGTVDKATVDRTGRRAAARTDPGFKLPIKGGGRIVSASPPTVGDVGQSKPGSEARERKIADRKRHLDRTTPQRKLPDHTEYKRIGAIMAEALLFEFDPRHEKRETSKRPGARGAQISGSLAADYAGDQEKRKADKDLSSKDDTERRAKKAANRARNRVGGTTGQQADPVLNNPDERAAEREDPEPKNPQEKANMVRRARQQRAKKGDR